VILEAAQKLDERRRDSMNAGPPRAAASAGSVAAGSSASSRYPGPPVDTGLERPSLADTMLRPAMTPPLEAPGPSPERFLVPDRRGRRRSRLGMLGAVLGLAAAGVAASLIGNRLGTSQDPRVNEPPEIIATAPGSRPAASEVAESAETPEASRAPDAPASAPAPPVRVPSPAAVPGVVAPERAVPERAATERATRTNEPAPRVAAPAPPVSTSFELNITSKPPRASVYEGNRVLGKTPLRVTISKASVAGGPREFILRLGGYLPVKISQAASSADVDAAVVLSPRPAVDEVPDGGLYEPELDLADSAGARSGSSKPRRRDLGIRMRR
jgi:hypothetical protein